MHSVLDIENPNPAPKVGTLALVSGQGMEETVVVVQSHCSHPNVQRTAHGEWCRTLRPLLGPAGPR